MSNIITTADIERIFNDLIYTSEFKLYKTIVNENATYDIILKSWKILGHLSMYNRTFPNDNVKIEIFRKNINVYNLEQTYFYKNNLISDIKKYIPIEGFILNKHVVKKYPHTYFDLNKTFYVPFKYTTYFEVFFVFDIEDKRDTYADVLNQMVSQQIMPPEIIEKIALDLGMTETTKDDTYNKSQFPFNFVSKYKVKMPECFIKEQLIELYKMGILKIAYYAHHDTINILTDEAYDYVFPNDRPNKIKDIFSSKDEMHKFIDEHIEQFIKN